MNSTQSEWLSASYLRSMEDDLLIRKILLTHNPDGRYLDSELLLQAMESVMSSTATPQVTDVHYDDTNISSNIEVVGSEETLGRVINRISREMLLKCYEDGDIHVKITALFDMLGYYNWDAKVVLILGALAANCGEYWLLMQMCPHNPLAASLALLKQFPSDLSLLRIQFKALSLSVNTMILLAKVIIKFEGLPLKEVLLDNKEMALTKSQIYLAAYWIFRNSLEWSSQITNLIDMKHEKDTHSTITTEWGLSSSVSRLKSLCSDLAKQVDLCNEQIGSKWYKKLLDLSKNIHEDNQEIIHMLFAMKDDTPLKSFSSQSHVNISELKNKEVILLVSKPELLPIEQIHLLVQQTCDHPYHKKIGRSYEVIWISISSSNTWSDSERKNFIFLSNSLPWLSIRKPWLLSSPVENFIKQEWKYKEQQPLMVVLDSRGMVSNLNAMDMVFIWGADAFPFSTSKERELWEEQKRTMKLLLDGIDPLLLQWVEDGRSICIYGSDDLDWIKEFSLRMNKIKTSGLQLEVIYVGRKNPRENTPKDLTMFDKANFYDSLKLTKINLFWLRLESMKRSVLRLGGTVDNHSILKEVLWLLEMNENNEKWALIGNDKFEDVLMLQDTRVWEFFNLFPVWGENVGNFGLVNAIKIALEPHLLGAPCDHTTVVPYEEGLIEEAVVCGKCKRPIEKFVVYKCDATEQNAA